MTAPLVLFLAAAVLPVFFSRIRMAPPWLALQGLALAWAAGARQGTASWHDLALLAEVLLLRGLVAPLLLRHAISRRGGAQRELMPSNLFVWAAAVALIVLAFQFGAPVFDDRQALTLGVVAATVVVALLLLAANDAPPAQLLALLYMENAIALFEQMLPQPWPLPVHAVLAAVYLLTVGVGAWLVGRSDEAALADPAQGRVAGA